MTISPYGDKINLLERIYKSMSQNCKVKANEFDNHQIISQYIEVFKVQIENK